MAESSILVVEDELTLRKLLEYRLGKRYRVRSATNGEQALRYIADEAPDLIISDIMMPVMDGFVLQSTLQQQHDTRAIPFIFLTAKVDEESRKRGQQMGVDDYITKPFEIEHLLSRVERLLDRARQYRSQLDARTARHFSEMLMPKELPQVPGYEIFFHNRPKDQGGGDLFDWMSSPQGGHLFTIGDVMGKGLDAKFYAFSFLGYVRSALRTMEQATVSPAQMMDRVNTLLLHDLPLQETYASLLLLRWNPDRHEVTYANAGHCRPLLVDANGARLIEHSDIILGLHDEADFTDTTLALPPGTAIVAYTDGLMEQPTESGEMVGEAGMMAAVAAAYGQPDPVHALLDHLLQKSPEDHFKDDILVFWLQREA